MQRTLPHDDVLRAWVASVAEQVMQAEVAEILDAGRYQRTPHRNGYRNGYRIRRWNTRVGTIMLRVPKVRPGSYFPSFLRRGVRDERALLELVREAYVSGVSTRKVAKLIKAMGANPPSRSKVSVICKRLDRDVRAFQARPLDGRFRYVWLDAVHHHVRHRGRVRLMAAAVAIGLAADGSRQVLGFEVGPTETVQLWTRLLRSLRQRGLRRVDVIVSDRHPSLPPAIRRVYPEAEWQCCRVHWTRSVLASAPPPARGRLADRIREAFAIGHRAEAARTLARLPLAVDHRLVLPFVVTYLDHPRPVHRQLHSTNPVERVNREIKRRTIPIGIFPNRRSLWRLVGGLLAEVDRGWEARERISTTAADVASSVRHGEPPLTLGPLPVSDLTP